MRAVSLGISALVSRKCAKKDWAGTVGRRAGPGGESPSRPWLKTVDEQGASSPSSQTRTVARSPRPNLQGRDRKMAQMVTNAGIDVSKQWLDVALWPKRDEVLRVNRDAAGLEELALWLRQRHVVRVGLEASGGYEREVIDALEAQGFEVALLNPLQVRRFAQAKGRLARTTVWTRAPSRSSPP